MWVVLTWKMVVLLIFTNFFQLQNVQIWTVSKCKGVYLLIFRNGIFRLRNIQIRAVPSCKRVDLLMIRVTFSKCETLNMGSAVQQ